MQFGLLLPQFPHVRESHAYYDTLLVLNVRESHPFAAFWRRLTSRVA
ncbi:hypothetical protein LJ655_14285 [Paraburkholderia sp. MMS20-SJTN17]|uniref:Uncharacterized protein n=1 Tax=Paraburkholderia translucens TaxID=2886945 RepID=A0ABS8KE50_9BURK|nr:hypothetical protein [Paraburkholderia sp. MMS20-SJTN17]MCC8403040.1 hypothetical protein [Paraburkholderia sp. MMS20-SJTN17]